MTSHDQTNADESQQGHLSRRRLLLGGFLGGNRQAETQGTPPGTGRSDLGDVIAPVRQQSWSESGCGTAPTGPGQSPGFRHFSTHPDNAVARINPVSCLAYRGTFCTVCSERCPEEGAITVTNGRPTVNVDHCTGCGDCADACPAPHPAIAITEL